jgi:hypothetical protein
MVDRNFRSSGGPDYAALRRGKQDTMFCPGTIKNDDAPKSGGRDTKHRGKQDPSTRTKSYVGATR